MPEAVLLESNVMCFSKAMSSAMFRSRTRCLVWGLGSGADLRDVKDLEQGNHVIPYPLLSEEGTP